MNKKQLPGYLLIAFGILLIAFSVFSVYQVFTGQKKPSPVFNLESPSFKLPSANISTSQLDLSQINIPGVNLEELIPPAPKEESASDSTQEVKFIPDELLNGLANLSLHLILMSFISSSGVKLASLGIKLIKTLPSC